MNIDKKRKAYNNLYGEQPSAESLYLMSAGVPPTHVVAMRVTLLNLVTQINVLDEDNRKNFFEVPISSRIREFCHMANLKITPTEADYPFHTYSANVEYQFVITEDSGDMFKAHIHRKDKEISYVDTLWDIDSIGIPDRIKYALEAANMLDRYDINGLKSYLVKKEVMRSVDDLVLIYRKFNRDGQCKSEQRIAKAIV